MKNPKIKKIISAATKKKAAERNKKIRERLRENPNLEKCEGIMHSYERCNKYPDENEKYCKSHEYFKDLTDVQIELIKNKSENAIKCTRCQSFHFDKDYNHCPICLEENKIYNAKVSAKKKIRKKCEWIDRYADPCRNWPVNDTLYCDDHKYVCDYTEEQKAKSRLCKGCNRYVYIEEKDLVTCIDCRNRGDKNRALNKEKTKDDPVCPAIIDDHICGHKITINGYCGQHKLIAWKNEVELDGKNRVCVGYKRKCKNVLDINFDTENCLDCLYKKAFSDAKSGANKNNRQYEFLISKEFYYKLTKEPCHYCGEFNIKGWNGIDRKNNNLGYIDENCVPCCTMCNIMKNNYTVQQFINHCKNIYLNYPSQNLFEDDSNVTHMTYKAYAGLADTRKIEFRLEEKEFNEILKKKCFYCNNTNLPNSIGIDRVLSNYIYVKNNCVACCAICNKMKNQYMLSEFIRKIKIILNRKNLIL